MQGTTWTAPNEGSRLDEILWAFDHGRGFISMQQRFPILVQNPCSTDFCTNLELTGAPINEYDWQRLESAAFKVGE